MKKRKIAVFTGGRFEYGVLKSVIRAIHNTSELKLQLVVSGIHILPNYGSTINTIRKDNFPIAAISNIVVPDETPGKVSLEIGKGVLEFTKILLKLKPDVVLVNGDRSEALAFAIAASFIPIPVAHTHGGDVTKAGFDESIRHSITKLAHIHFAATKKSWLRILKMGENPKNVYLVGAPGLDDLLSEPNILLDEIETFIGGKITGNLVIVLQHPVSTSPETSSFEIKQTLKALDGIGGTKILVYPNGDVGSEDVITEIEKMREKPGYFILKSIPRNIYANLLRIADVFVGNSSGGIIETASFGLPTINVGTRQFGRERNSNILDVDYNSEKIKSVLLQVIKRKKRFPKNNIYGNGKAGLQVVDVLGRIRLDLDLVQKHFYETNK